MIKEKKIILYTIQVIQNLHFNKKENHKTLEIIFLKNKYPTVIVAI